MAAATKGTYWVFIINDPCGYRPAFNEVTMRYLAYCRQQLDTPALLLRLCGYVAFKKTTRLAAVVSMLAPTATVEAATGTEGENIAELRRICCDDDMKEFGQAELLSNVRVTGLICTDVGLSA